MSGIEEQHAWSVESSPGLARQRTRRSTGKYRLRRTRVSLAVVGVLLMAGSGIVRFVVLPAVAKLPTNSNTTNVYKGTAPVLLNTAGLKPGSTAPLVLHNLPLVITESVKVLKSNNSAAVVDYRTAETAPGVTLPTLDYHYVVDRTSLGSSTSLSAAGITPSRGLTISFPIGTLEQNYQGWVQDTERTTPLRFSGTASSVKLGSKTYAFGFEADVFQQRTPAAPITDKEELATFPSGIPKSEIPAIVTRLHLPASELSGLAAAFSKLPSMIPLEYTYAATYTYWVAPRDGVAVDLRATETRTVELPASLTDVAVPIATVSQFVYTDSPATLLARIHEAQSDTSSLRLVGTILPLLALIVGFLLVVAAGALRLRRPGAGPAAGEQPVVISPSVTRKVA